MSILVLIVYSWFQFSILSINNFLSFALSLFLQTLTKEKSIETKQSCGNSIGGGNAFDSTNHQVSKASFVNFFLSFSIL
ncbi:hypothetical protein HanPSC8_Chr06g0255601 [Helianthus annuus]|nr:hypothetical protein HanPSC8_Chr06g0255601 [Helianthus annuus]